MKTIATQIVRIFCVALILSASAVAQSLKHPVIYVTNDEKPQIIALIEQNSWAQSLVNQLHTTVDSKVTAHETNPNLILGSIPNFPANDGNSESASSSLASGHNKVLTYASYAGMLYFLTDDEKYAQFAADILAFYMDEISARTVANTTISGNYFYDPRTTYPHFAVAYDFVYNFLQKPDTKVYDKTSGSYVAYNKAKAQKAITNIAGNALKEAGGYDTYGKTISNHPILTAPGALFPILCVEDDEERERLFNVFYVKGTKRQNSFKNTILPMFGEQGIWPESTSYSFMPNISLIINVIDRIKPELNLATTKQNIFDGVFLFENLRYPDRRYVRYGDSKRNNDNNDNNYRYVLNLAKRKGCAELQSKAELALQQFYNAEGGRNPRVVVSTFDNYSALELFWGEPFSTSSAQKFDYKPTVVVKHAGVVLQRNYVNENNFDYGLCGIIGGAHYVHSHCTGIAMELYGAGYVMGPNGGLPPSTAERQIPEHTDYFRLYAGNNTVIVNGTSHGTQSGAWNSNSYLWQNTTVNIAAEPKHLENPIANDFSFATQFLDDNVNNCDQQRTLSTIRTSATTGYYFDMFRSKSNVTNNFHDYIYHNLGDETQIVNVDNDPLPLIATDRYNNDIGDPVHSPGWRFFEDTKVTAPTNEAVNVRFRIAYNDYYMHLFIPGGVEREYTKALAPATREAKNGYVDKKTQVLAIRQQGEAWNKPYVAIFEPSKSLSTSVSGVSQLEVDNKVVGGVVQSTVGQKLIVDYIICNDVENETINLPEENISFTGRFAIVRVEQQNNTERVSLYIGEGSQLTYNTDTLFAGPLNKGYKMVGVLDTTFVKTDIEIEAEDYDLGGEGVAYHDRESTNYGTAKDYREQGGVDLSNSSFVSSGIVVARVRPDEWLNYTFTVDKTSTYYLGVFASNSSSTNPAIKAYLDDSLVVEDLLISYTGNTNIYQTSEALNSFLLDSGMHTLQIYIKQADFNFDKIILRKDLLYNAINEVKSSQIKVFPNPSNGQFLIHTAQNTPATYKLYTLNGTLVLSGSFNSETMVNVSPSLKGMYMLEVVSSGRHLVQKVVFNP